MRRFDGLDMNFGIEFDRFEMNNSIETQQVKSLVFHGEGYGTHL